VFFFTTGILSFQLAYLSLFCLAVSFWPSESAHRALRLLPVRSAAVLF
jgi:hypothetical protein